MAESTTDSNAGAGTPSVNLDQITLNVNGTIKQNGTAVALSGHSHTPSSIGAAAANHTHTAAQVGALPITGGTLTGNLTIKGSGNYGTKINLGDGDYVHISEPTDDCLEIKAKKINFVVSDSSDSKFTLNNVKILTSSDSGSGSGTGTKASATVPIVTSEGAPVEIEIPDSLKGKTLLVEFISGYTSGNTTIEAQVYGVRYSEPSDYYEAYGCTFCRYGDTIHWGSFNHSAAGMHLRFTEL